jgi:hypothetical protein
MINALFVLIVFLLQLNKDSLHVKWPISARINVTYDEITQEVNCLWDIDHAHCERQQFSKIKKDYWAFFFSIVDLELTTMNVNTGR